MPWKIIEKNDEFCVVKKGATGAEPEVIKCHPDKGKAQAHMRALYAKVEENMSIKVRDLAAPSLSERLEAISSAFHSFREPDPNPRNCYIKEVYDGYLLVTDGKKIYKVGYTVGEDMKVEFDPSENWKEQKMVDAQMFGFVFTELTGHPGVFDGLAASEDVAFVSMSGEELFIEPADLEQYIKNGQAVIESTRTASGEIIGLPVDLSNHDHKGGAGWIKEFELDKARNIVKFMVEWTEAGVNLIKGGMSRFFSPTVDPINKIILGGSLTNWPASRNSMGQLLLQPIELSQTMKGMNTMSIEETLAAINARLDAIEKQKPGKPKGASADLGADGIVEEDGDDEILPEIQHLSTDEDGLNQLGELAQRRAHEIVRVAQRKAHVVEFVSKVVSGTPENPVGLPIQARELTRILLSLPEKQSLMVERLLAKVWDSVLDFRELGIASGDEYQLRKPVPPQYAELLRSWVNSGNTPQSFFETNPEAGRAEDFNLSPYFKKEA